MHLQWIEDSEEPCKQNCILIHCKQSQDPGHPQKGEEDDGSFHYSTRRKNTNIVCVRVILFKTSYKKVFCFKWNFGSLAINANALPIEFPKCLAQFFKLSHWTPQT